MMGGCEIFSYVFGCVACCALQVTFIVYLGIFAFANPDKRAYYVISADSPKMTETAVNGSAVDVHAQFVAWFTWGFIMMLCPCAIGLILVLTSFFSDTCTSLLGTFFNCAAGCTGIAWWVCGIVWRFKASGSFASGDELNDVEFSAE